MKRLLIGLGIVCFAAACGGGGGSSSVTPTTGGPTKGYSANDTIRVTFPNSQSSSSRRKAVLTANTASFTLQVYTVNGATPSPLPTPLSIPLSSSPDCQTTASGITCTVNFPVPIASKVVIQVLTYDANGNVIGGELIGPIDTTQATIPAQTATTITFSPQSLPSLLSGGAAGTITVSETNYASAFITPAPSSVATLTCVPANCTPTSAGGNVAINVLPGTAGTETLTVRDANGGFVNIPIAVTSSGTGGTPIVGAPPTIYTYATSAGGKNYGITVGPDGQTLWFVDRGNATLGAVTSPANCNGTSCTVAEVAQAGLPAYLQGITAAPDGNLYVTDVGNPPSDLGSIVQETCSTAPSCAGTQITNFGSGYIATPAPAEIIAAPDGDLYATSAYSDSFNNGYIFSAQIAGCCASGFPSYYFPSPISTSQLDSLAVDQTGTILWFTDTGNGAIGFLPLSCLSCYAREEPTNYGYLIGGAAHPHPPGGVFRTPPHQRRGLIPPAGTAFTPPLNGIVAAPDGYLYVANAGGNAIIRISPTVWYNGDSGCATTSAVNCTFTAITIPTNASATPQNVVVGPDGNVWFTDTTGYVGFVSLQSCATTCKAYEYHVGGSPWGITKGPDENIWFTDSSTNKIGEVVLP